MKYPFYKEFLSERPPCSVLLASTSLHSDEQVTVCYHLIFIPEPCEVVGDHLGTVPGNEEEVMPSSAMARFWIQSSNTDNYLPYRVVPGSDTRYLNSTNDFEVDIGYLGNFLFYPLLTGGDYTFRVILANPVRIDVPGMYWIGWAHQSVGEGEYLCSTVQGMPNGMKDLVYTGSTHASNVNGFNPPEVLNIMNTEISAGTYPWIDIALICQLIPPEVPYGG